MEIDQSIDGSMSVGRSEEGMGESQGGAQASGFDYPSFTQDPGYPMGGMSEYSSFVPYPTYMPYMPYPHYYPPYPMYPSSPTHPSAAHPEL